MNRHLIIYVFMAAFLGTAYQAEAQSFLVKKVKGKQALIEMTKGEFEPNQEYSLRGNKVSTGTDRGHLIGIEGLNTAFTSKTSDSGTATSTLTRFELSGTLGWNSGHTEFGPAFSFVSSNGGSSTSLLGVGGFFDYNFQENRPGQNSIWGIFGAGLYTTQDAGGAKTNGTKLAVGGFFKWFPFNEWLCLRINLKSEYSESKTETTTVKETSIIANAGIATYF